MKIRTLLILFVFATVPRAMGADTNDRTSPVDKNAACMDRTVDASSGNCVVKDEGTPRRTYPPKQSPAVAAPATAPVAAPATARKAASGSR